MSINALIEKERALGVTAEQWLEAKQHPLRELVSFFPASQEFIEALKEIKRIQNLLEAKRLVNEGGVDMLEAEDLGALDKQQNAMLRRLRHLEKTQPTGGR